MRKSKQNKHKRLYGTNLKVNPLKKFKKQIKRMNHRLQETDIPAEKKQVYTTRLKNAELELKNWDKNQELKRQADMAAKASKKS